MLKIQATLWSIILLILCVTAVKRDSAGPQRRQLPEVSQSVTSSASSSLLVTSSTQPITSGPSNIASQTTGAISDATNATTTNALVSTTTTSSYYTGVASNSSSTPTSQPSTSTTSTSGAASGILVLPSPVNESNIPLPIQPQITPAFGIAGVLLIITGIPYAFIGVRGRWMHITFSVAYLSALAITVLIVYVANPPISNAVQGAYFVGIFVPACILGGIAIIFPEATQGLGCLFGGFCLSMWFMVWKDGGLITSEGGRIALTIVLSFTAFSLSFIPYTRTYALMSCTAFAGSTAIMLGVDCFSRAGLKEFWVYTWDLNTSLFPPGTKTFPSTHGIRAEDACIVILTCTALLSQTKLWNIYRKHCDRLAADRAQDEEDRRHLEDDVARRLEIANRRERAQWEAIYGDKEQLPTSISNFSLSNAPSLDSRPTTGLSTYAAPPKSLYGHGSTKFDNVEMTEMHPVHATRRSHNVSVAEPDKKQLRRSVATETRDLHTSSSPGSAATNKGHSVQQDWRMLEGHSSPITQPIKAGANMDHLKQLSLSPSDPPPPPVLVSVPFPASAPRQNTATVTDVPMDPNQVSLANHQDGQNECDLDDEHFNCYDEDLASSVVGTWDGQVEGRDSLPPLTRSPSPNAAQIMIETVSKPRHRKIGSTSDMNSAGSRSKGAFTAPRRNSAPLPDELQILISEPSDGRPILFADARRRIFGLDDLEDEDSLQGNLEESKSLQAFNKSSPSLQRKNTTTATNPRITQPYWTNEWAKSLQMADRPGLEKLEPTLDGILINHENVDAEDVAPVNTEELKQTANGPPPSRANSTSFRPANSHGFSNGLPMSQRSSIVEDQISAALARNPSKPFIHIAANGVKHTNQIPSARSKTTPLQRSASQPYMAPSILRSTSRPRLAETLLESPTEEAGEHDSSMALSRSYRAHQAVSSVKESPSSSIQSVAPQGIQSRSGSRIGSSWSREPSNRTHDSANSNKYSLPPAARQSLSLDVAVADSSARVQHQQIIHEVRDDERQMNLGSGPVNSLSRRQSLQENYQQMPPHMLQAQSSNIPIHTADNYISQPPQVYQWPTSADHYGPSRSPSINGRNTSPIWPNPIASRQNPFPHDSHQPHRGSSFNASVQESRLANWHMSLHAEAQGGISQQQQTMMNSAQLLAMHEQRSRENHFRQKMEEERGMREYAMDMRMRSGEMVSTHRSILRKMEAEAQALNASTS